MKRTRLNSTLVSSQLALLRSSLLAPDALRHYNTLSTPMSTTLIYHLWCALYRVLHSLVVGKVPRLDVWTRWSTVRQRRLHTSLQVAIPIIAGPSRADLPEVQSSPPCAPQCSSTALQPVSAGGMAGWQRVVEP